MLPTVVHIGTCQSTFTVDMRINVTQSGKSFAVHVSRNHTQSGSKGLPDVQSCLVNGYAQFQCSVGYCRKSFLQKRNFMSHLKVHFQSGVQVPCPKAGCKSKSFSTLSSFTGHISKYHNHRPNPNSSSLAEVSVHENDLVCNDSPSVQSDSLCDENNDQEISEYNPAQEIGVLSKDQYFIYLAEFYQKLAYKHLVPESIVQVIAEELKYFLSENNKFYLNDVKAALLKCDIPTDIAQDVIACMLPENNILSVCRTLRSNHMRTKAFREFFSFSEPQSVDLGDGKFFYYVPVEENLKAAFKNKSWNFKLSSQPSKDDVLRDFTYGMSFVDNEFFKNNPSAIKIIIYQDGIELVCPIGPAHNLEHKLLGVCVAFGDLPSDIRFQKDSIQLVAFCREKDFNLKIVYGKIVEDLLKVQRSGIVVSHVGVVKAGLAFIAVDNLGSHCLAGLITSFSRSILFCCYCMVQRSMFVKNGGEVKTCRRRTPDLYNNACEYLQNNPSKKNFQGVKYDSEFNQIEGYHVCSYGLPPCLGHDLFEGVIAHDVKLFIKYFIQEKPWFDLDELNDVVKCFPYSSEDKRDRPCKINKLEKERLAGGAWQLSTFLKLFPLLVRGSVNDFDDPVWKCMLLLREINLIVDAPEIHVSHLPYLKCIIEDYLVLRKELFPLVCLRPKHHYLLHYPELLYQVGPLIKVWTMRFESKHCFFMEAWRSSGHNSINVLKTLSYKHEFSQCHARSGGNLKVTVLCGGSRRQIHRLLYSDVIMAEIMKCPLYSALEDVENVTIKGTQYNKGNVLVLKQNSIEDRLDVGIIFLIFHCDRGVFFLTANHILGHIK